MKSKKQQYGQYFTDNTHVNDIINIIKDIRNIDGNLLEPSFGEGSFIEGFQNFNLNIDAYEVDNTLKKVTFNDNVNILYKDFLFNDIDTKYDFIVGNPPYIELSYCFYSDEIQAEIKSSFKKGDGRINLTHMFIDKSLSLLKDNGILAFLLPSSILTSPYYKTIRKEICENYNIEYVKNDVKFKGVAVKVSLIILSKTSPKDKYFVKYNDYFITENYLDFPKEIITLKEKNFEVNIGEVVWNQKKDLLTDDSSENRLIYSRNIKSNRLDFQDSKGDKDKKPFIKNTNIKYINCIVTPRTVSNELKVYFVKNNENLVFENHVLVITHGDVDMLDKLYNILQSDDLKKFIKLFFNSSNISKNEFLSLPFEII